MFGEHSFSNQDRVILMALLGQLRGMKISIRMQILSGQKDSSAPMVPLTKTLWSMPSGLVAGM